MQLANEVVSNASVDLDPKTVEGSDVVSSTNRAVVKPGGKKRKHSTNSGTEAENAAIEVGVPHNHSISPISLKIAALEALETLLTTVSSFNLSIKSGFYWQCFNLVGKLDSMA